MHRGGQRLVGPANFEQRGEGGLERSCLYGGVLFFALTGMFGNAARDPWGNRWRSLGQPSEI